MKPRSETGAALTWSGPREQRIPPTRSSRQAGAASLCITQRNQKTTPRLFYHKQMTEVGMSHWRKRNPPAHEFNARLSRWALALTALVGILVALSLHQHV